jgi:hypothetical protein
MKLLLRLLREPLLHFLAIGGLIFVVYTAINDRGEAPADVIVITPERIDQLAAGFNSVWMRMPNDDELDALIDEEVREEVYYRGALALGLDRDDAIVRRRMRQKMEFLLDTGAYLREPAVGELEAYFAANEDFYRRGLRLAFEQVYFGEAPEKETIVSSLGALLSDPQSDPSTLGKSSLLPPQLGLSPRNAVDSVFGKGFFDLILELSPGEWAGPIASAYGVHLVRILERLPARTPPLDEIHDAVLRNWMEAKTREIRELDYTKRRKAFIVDIRRGDVQPTENQ